MPRCEREGVLFVGNFRHAPNVDAAVDFCADAWPLVRAALPGARLQLVGTAPPPAVQALAGDDVEVTGWVPETSPYLDARSCSVAPLRYGAGVKGKIGEALAHGLPVVTTTVGAEGMDLVDGEHALIADGAQELAAAVVRLHDDAICGSACRGRAAQLVERRLSPRRRRRALRTGCSRTPGAARRSSPRATSAEDAALLGRCCRLLGRASLDGRTPSRWCAAIRPGDAPVHEFYERPGPDHRRARPRPERRSPTSP